MVVSNEFYYIYQVIFGAARTRTDSLLEYELWSGPYQDMKTAVKEAEALRQSQPDVYYSFVIKKYKGEHWSYHFEQTAN